MTVSQPSQPTEPSPQSQPPVLSMPADGVPDVVDTPSQLERTCRALAAGSGPVGIDTERAHGFRWSPRAWLIQIRREGSGTHLIDPVALQDTDTGLAPLAEALAGTEWILHAATQDMPCLAMEGLRPDSLFDTELAGRLLNQPRVGLAAMVERYCGVRLLKEHSASDWSRRPLPTDWLVYAALDVELLAEVRAGVLSDLRAAGKDDWARQEFDHLVGEARGLPSQPPGIDPSRWRRLGHIGDIDTRAGLQLAHDLWLAREEIAREEDRAPGRVLRDEAIVALARRCGSTVDLTPAQLSSGRTLSRGRRHMDRWQQALAHAASVPPSRYPPRRVRSTGIPSPRSWERHHPEAAARWEVVRPGVNRIAAEVDVPPENLCSPAWLRQFAWQPPRDLSPLGVDAFLSELGARIWQRNLLSGPLSRMIG